MKVHIDLPWGGMFEMESQPMADGRFEMICWLIGITLVGSGLLKLFLTAAGR